MDESAWKREHGEEKGTDEGAWKRKHGEERRMEEVFVLEREKVVGRWGESPLNTDIIKKRSERRQWVSHQVRNEINEAWLHFRIIAKLGNSKRQHCSKIYIYIYISWGPLFEKAHKGKEEGKTERAGKSFIHIWTAGTLHMFRGLNVDDHFGKPNRKKKPGNMSRRELVSG